MIGSRTFAFGMRPPGLALGVFAILLMFAPARTWGQADENLKDRVLQLVDRLGSENEKERKDSEAALRKLGAKIVPLLPAATALPSDGVRKAVEKLRADLTAEAANFNRGASLITFQGKDVRLSDVIRELQKQSGNRITDLREEQENPTLTLDFQKKPFFEALDEVAKKSKIGVSFYTADGSIGLSAGAMMPNPAAAPDAENAPKDALKAPATTYAGPFRIDLSRMVAVRDFRTKVNTASIGLEVAWEPRLRPMLLQLNYKDCEILDDRNEKIAPAVKQETVSAVLRPENPVIEINFDIQAPNRAAKAISKFKVKGNVSIPGGQRTFKFPSLVKKNQTEKQDDVSVTLISTEVEETVWKVNVLVEFAEGNEALESYRQGMLNNQLYLLGKDGSRFEHNGGFSQTRAGEGKLGFEYIFVDAPGTIDNYSFVYVTPSRVDTIPLEFEFRDIPLP